MKTEATNAVFSLAGYKIPRFSLQEATDAADLHLRFNPSGRIEADRKTFTLNLELKVFTEATESPESQSPIATVELEAYFRFQEAITLETLPDYFYANAIAIVFPYLRAFLSTLTQQANLKMILLPVMNLTALEGILKEQTQQL